MKRRVGCALLWAAVLLWVPPAAGGSEEILDQIKEKVRANLSRQPDYMCLETVDRFWRRSAASEFERLDTLHLEVGLAGDREMFAWRGARKFSDKDLSDLVGSGAVGSGNFAMRARNVFLSGGATFTDRGEALVGERKALRFDYEVPARASGYRVRGAAFEAVVGFHGSFWVDAATLDLLRLEVEADDIPAELGLARTHDVLEYAPIRIGEADFILPSSSQLTMVSARGHENQNRTRFTGCRQYTAESRLSFDDGASDQPARPAAALVLAPRLKMELTLDSEIQPETAAVGDAVRAVLHAPLQLDDGYVAAKGAPVHGRVVRVEKQSLPFEHYVVALEFHTLETGRGAMQFSATMEDAAPFPGLVRQERRLNPTFDRKRAPKLAILVREQPRGQGVLHWEARKPRIPRGVRMIWMTEEESAPSRGAQAFTAPVSR
jgi:hypothetical protein